MFLDSIGVIILLGFVGAWAWYFIRRDYLLGRNYQWYAQTHPEAMRGNRATCYKCGSSRIHTRSKMNHMYIRVHLCGNCGEELYHSKESR